MSSVKVHFPVLPLQEAVSRPGGITRENALEAAQENVREISGEADQTIETAILALEAMRPAGGNFTVEQLRSVLAKGDEIINLAGTFGYVSLDRATRSLCDITDGLIQAGKGDFAPVAVHVRAMRLFSPLATAPGPEQSVLILEELAKVTAHYGFSPLA
ncbi:MAG TPA: hypothetical protein VG798_03640 [Rhizomicrobium sp.]|nr:hypothetical protein [Rhizomicrobium sp.]